MDYWKLYYLTSGSEAFEIRGEKVTIAKTISTLREALDIKPKEVVSLVGAGGKTALMFALARELTSPQGLVITTTTTKMFPPSADDTPLVFLSGEEKKIVDFIVKHASKLRHVTIAAELLVDCGKLQGVNPHLVTTLTNLVQVMYTIVEADGAARRPLKAPNLAFEPVIPQRTSLVIPVVGIDALGCKLSEENVFRSEIASKLTGLPLGETISPQTIADLILHPSGVIVGSPDQARVIPFINKMDLHADLSIARDLASKILDKRHPRIDRVVLGQARLDPPVAEVAFKR